MNTPKEKECCEKCHYPGDFHENSHGIPDPATSDCSNESCECHTKTEELCTCGRYETGECICGKPLKTEANYTLQAKPVGEVRFNGIVYIPKTKTEVCTCASFFTVRGVHKPDCPAKTEVCGEILHQEAGYGKYKLPPQPDEITARCGNYIPCPLHSKTEVTPEVMEKVDQQIGGAVKRLGNENIPEGTSSLAGERKESIPQTEDMGGWEKRFEEQVSGLRMGATMDKSGEVLFDTVFIKSRIKSFIAKELSAARSEAKREVLEKIVRELPPVDELVAYAEGEMDDETLALRLKASVQMGYRSAVLSVINQAASTDTL